MFSCKLGRKELGTDLTGDVLMLLCVREGAASDTGPSKPPLGPPMSASMPCRFEVAQMRGTFPLEYLLTLWCQLTQLYAGTRTKVSLITQPYCWIFSVYKKPAWGTDSAFGCNSLAKYESWPNSYTVVVLGAQHWRPLGDIGNPASQSW